MAGASEHNRVIGWSWRLLQVLAFALFIRNTPLLSIVPARVAYYAKVFKLSSQRLKHRPF